MNGSEWPRAPVLKHRQRRWRRDNAVERSYLSARSTGPRKRNSARNGDGGTLKVPRKGSSNPIFMLSSRSTLYVSLVFIPAALRRNKYMRGRGRRRTGAKKNVSAASERKQQGIDVAKSYDHTQLPNNCEEFLGKKLDRGMEKHQTSVPIYFLVEDRSKNCPPLSVDYLCEWDGTEAQ